jgi:hypothetical protein
MGRASSLGEALKLPQGIGPARLPLQQLDAKKNCWRRLLDRRARVISRDAVNMPLDKRSGSPTSEPKSPFSSDCSNPLRRARYFRYIQRA